FLPLLKRRKFYTRLLLSTILIAILPTLLLSIASYYNVTKSFKKKMSENSIQYLDQTINAMEIVITQIKESSQQLILNQSFKNFEHFPNDDYYENLSGEISKDDLSSNYWYIRNKKNSIESIRNFLLSNPFVDSVYYYDEQKDIVMAFNRGTYSQYAYADFFDTDWSGVIKSNKVSPVFMDTRVAIQKDTSSKNVFTIIYRANKETNAFIINLDAQVIYDNIIKKLNNKDEVYVLSSSGQVLFPFNKSEMNDKVEQFLHENTKASVDYPSFSGEFDERNVLVTYAESPLLQWSFYNIEDLKQLYESLNYLRNMIITFTIILILFVIILSFLLSQRLYEPIKHMTFSLKHKLGKETDAKINDEFQYIGNMIETTFEQRDQFKAKYEESVPFFVERFKYSLVRKGAYTIHEINEKKQHLHVDIDLDNLIVLLLSLDDLDMLEVLEADMYKIQIEEEIKRSHIIGNKYFMVETEDDRVAIVMNASKEETDNVGEMAANLISFLTDRVGGTFTIGVSRFCENILVLPQ